MIEQFDLAPSGLTLFIVANIAFLIPAMLLSSMVAATYRRWDKIILTTLALVVPMYFAIRIVWDWISAGQFLNLLVIPVVAIAASIISKDKK